MNSSKERFFTYVVKGPQPHHCWVWVGAIGDDGYGRFWNKDTATGKQRVYRAHRYAMQLHLRRDLKPHEHVLHRCDNPLCVKITAGTTNHLSIGSHHDNMADRSAKGRSNLQARLHRQPTKKQRAQNAQELRDYIAQHGYHQAAVDQLRLNISPEQQPLF